MTTHTIPALTFLQPIAEHIIALRPSDVHELLRSADTDHRGELAIHASRDQYLIDRSDWPTTVFGAVLGVVTVIETRRERNCWIWTLAKPKRFPHPVRLDGRPGLWQFTYDPDAPAARRSKPWIDRGETPDEPEPSASIAPILPPR